MLAARLASHVAENAPGRLSGDLPSEDLRSSVATLSQRQLDLNDITAARSKNVDVCLATFIALLSL